MFDFITKVKSWIIKQRRMSYMMKTVDKKYKFDDKNFSIPLNPNRSIPSKKSAKY